MKKLPVLENLLAYKNPLVLKRFSRNYPEYAAEAELYFLDMLKYLWLCVKHSIDSHSNTEDATLQFSMLMHKEMRVIDEMWHTFILVTQDYAQFCETYFGAFIHHVPEQGEEVKGETVDPVVFEEKFTRFLSYTYDALGEETVKRWFAAYI